MPHEEREQGAVPASMREELVSSSQSSAESDCQFKDKIGVGFVTVGKNNLIWS
jgi:hypothetical protein